MCQQDEQVFCVNSIQQLLNPCVTKANMEMFNVLSKFIYHINKQYCESNEHQRTSLLNGTFTADGHTCNTKSMQRAFNCTQPLLEEIGKTPASFVKDLLKGEKKQCILYTKITNCLFVELKKCDTKYPGNLAHFLYEISMKTFDCDLSTEWWIYGAASVGVIMLIGMIGFRAYFIVSR
ncbi:unnamed protein product [Diamesa hyperborea]